MKRFLCILFAAVLMLSVCSCNKTEEEQEESGISGSEDIRIRQYSGDSAYVDENGVTHVDVFTHLDEAGVFYKSGFQNGGITINFDDYLLPDFTEGDYHFIPDGDTHSAEVYHIEKNGEEIGTFGFVYYTDADDAVSAFGFSGLSIGDTVTVRASLRASRDATYNTVNEEDIIFNDELILDPAFEDIIINSTVDPLDPADIKGKDELIANSLTLALMKDDLTVNGGTRSILAVDYFKNPDIDSDSFDSDYNLLIFYYRTSADKFCHYYKMCGAYYDGRYIRDNGYSFDGYNNTDTSLSETRNGFLSAFSDWEYTNVR